jgi:glycogen debranching enzyme
VEYQRQSASGLLQQGRTSNAGQCLFAGLASPEHAWRVAQTLLASASFSGWGIRTVAASESRYNPMGYHTGSVWPHDNALIAQGLARYGLGEQVLHIWTGLFEAGLYFDLRRMPELFCGFPKDPGEGPVLYPVACAPQAWAAASVFLLLQACLGLEINCVWCPGRHCLSSLAYTRPGGEMPQDHRAWISSVSIIRIGTFCICVGMVADTTPPVIAVFTYT